jgi:hypothetical protein
MEIQDLHRSNRSSREPSLLDGCAKLYAQGYFDKSRPWHVERRKSEH